MVSIRLTIKLPGYIVAALRKSGTAHRRDRQAEITHYVERGLIADGYVVAPVVEPVAPPTEKEGA